MSKIIFYKESFNVDLVIYSQILQENISAVCNKIEFDDSEITWIIYDSKATYSNIVLKSALARPHRKDYAFCKPEQREIWISLLALHRSQNLIISKTASFFPYTSTTFGANNFLVNVLLDEITHIQTGHDHGSPIYDAQLRSNAEKYYLTPINRAMLTYPENKVK